MQSIPAHKRNIMIHCLATPKDWGLGKTPEDVLAAVHRWHVIENGWFAVAYAEIHMPDGTVIKGRDRDADGDVWEETGAGARGWNENTIHIALVGGGGSSATDKFEDHYTPEQDWSIRKSIDEIQQAARISGLKPLRVMGHNEVAAKACPGFPVPPWFDRKPPRSITGSKTIQGAAASASGIAAATIPVLTQLEGNAQLMSIGFLAIAALGIAWVFRSRMKDWANGRQ